MENDIINVIDLTQNYEGYLWWSNDSSPKVFHNEAITDLPEGNNPFIIEGQLYDVNNKKSYSIRFIDGEYMIKHFDLKDIKELEFVEKTYLPNRVDGAAKLCYHEYWRPVQDELCEGMEVLQPAEIVFVGFKYKEE